MLKRQQINCVMGKKTRKQDNECNLRDGSTTQSSFERDEKNGDS